MRPACARSEACGHLHYGAVFFYCFSSQGFFLVHVDSRGLVSPLLRSYSSGNSDGRLHYGVVLFLVFGVVADSSYYMACVVKKYPGFFFFLSLFFYRIVAYRLPV